MLFFCLSMVSMVAYAAHDVLPAKKYSLFMVYQLAKKNDTQLKAAEAQWLSIRELSPQSIAALLPNVSLNANSTYNRSEDLNSQIWRYNSHGYNLTLSQPVFNFSAFASQRQATHRVQAAALSYMAAQQDLILRVVNAYCNVLLAEDTLSFKKSEQQSIDEQLKNARIRYRVGLIAVTPMYEAQASADQTRAAVIAARNALDNARSQLYLLTQERVEGLAHFRSSFPLLLPSPREEKAWVQFSKTHNIEYLTSHYLMEAADANIAVQVGGHLPTVNMVANTVHNITGFNGFAGGLNTRTESIGLQISVPIFSSGSVLSKTRQARYEYDKSVAETEGALRQAKIGTEQLYRNVIADIEKVKADEATLRSTAQALHQVQLAYQAGARTAADVLQSQENQFSSQVQCALDRYRYINNTLALKKVAGLLNETDLQALDQWLKA